MTIAFRNNRPRRPVGMASASEVLDVNDRWCRIQGIERADGAALSIEGWSARIHPEERAGFRRGITGLMDGRLDVHENGRPRPLR